MKKPIDCVDVFHGNGAVDLPPPRGIAAAWDWHKAQVGNTHPGACLPFGMVSACAYSGAYPSGYGLYGPSSSGPTPRQFDRKTATGFTHFHHSGTGDIRAFYNYLKIIPLPGDTPPARWTLTDERASPGRYAATLAETGVRAELAVAPRAVVHRYTFPDGPAHLVLDPTAGGLDDATRTTAPKDVLIEIVSPRTVRGRFTALGITTWFQAETDLGGAQREGRTVRFNGPSRGDPVELRIGFSFRSAKQAAGNLQGVRDFERTAADARAVWEDHLDRIQVSGGSDAQREIFYSCLYHSLIKPIDGTDESPFWPGDGPCYLDFATMWDMVKTQLPLVMTVCSGRGSEIATAILAAMERFGRFPNALLIERDVARFENQSQGLAHHTLADAFLRGIDGVDWRRAVDLMAAAFETHTGPEFMERGRVLPASHTLDYANAAFATALVANAVGNTAAHARMLRLAGNWRNVFDPGTGLLIADSRYYEGTLWNYSFRPLPHMDERIALCGRERFIELLDTFFGFKAIADGSVDPAPTAEQFERLIRPNFFEGLNNESDIESPYAYIAAGRHDRTAEIVRAVLRYQYGTGNGGLPGNDDSGGLSSWYVWNAIGLFPVTGQDLVFIGSPLFNTAALAVRGGEFVVETAGNSDEAIYVRKAELNGRPVDHFHLRARDIAAGGRLRLDMGPSPA